jgi:hypothetical protein
MERNETIARIRSALKRRSGKTWSVTGGRGTAWGWIHISAPPKRLVNGIMTPTDQALLGQLLGLDGPAHCQYIGIPAASDYRREYIDRAEGKTPSVTGSPYWD